MEESSPARREIRRRVEHADPGLVRRYERIARGLQGSAGAKGPVPAAVTQEIARLQHDLRALRRSVAAVKAPRADRRLQKLMLATLDETDHGLGLLSSAFRTKGDTRAAARARAGVRALGRARRSYRTARAGLGLHPQAQAGSTA